MAVKVSNACNPLHPSIRVSPLDGTQLLLWTSGHRLLITTNDESAGGEWKTKVRADLAGYAGQVLKVRCIVGSASAQRNVLKKKGTFVGNAWSFQEHSVSNKNTSLYREFLFEIPRTPRVVNEASFMVERNAMDENAIQI